MSADGQHRASLEILRDAICEYVEDLQGRGVNSDEIANAIRHRVGVLRSSGDLVSTGLVLDGLVDEMVASCLEPTA